MAAACSCTLSVSLLSWTRRQREKEKEREGDEHEGTGGWNTRKTLSRAERIVEQRRTRCVNPRKCDREWNFCCKLDTPAFIEVLTSKEIATRDVCSGYVSTDVTLSRAKFFLSSFFFFCGGEEGGRERGRRTFYYRFRIYVLPRRDFVWRFLVFRILYARGRIFISFLFFLTANEICL